ncbi:MAG: pilus (MSHA type) biogenesis protein MshL [Deltaproteobacteria bacterium]|nr:pilus (MSHA type) biogenesis protein MshL [Deltaproteobacteria bacterium]
MSRLTNYIVCMLCIMLLFSCATTKRIEKEQFTMKQEMAKVTPIKPRELPKIKPAPKKPSPLEGKTITITAKDSDFRDVLNAIAHVAGLNLVIDSRLRSAVKTNETKPEESSGDIIVPGVTVTLKNAPLKDALDDITRSINVFYQVDNKTLYIKGIESRIYHLNCIASQKDVTVSVGGDVLGSSTLAESSTSPLTGEFTIRDKKDTTSTDIYTQIQTTIKSMISPLGHFSLNRSIGLLEVTDRRSSLERIDTYLARVVKYYTSQVLIKARVLEVTLNDESQYGIDWSSIHGNIGNYKFNPIRQNLKLPTGGSNPTPALEMIISSEKHGFDATINALEQFGKVKVLSDPRIRVINGQPALISMGESRSFIKHIELTTTTTEGGTTITQPDVEISSIFDGIMLGVLPYIDFERNFVNMSITPIKSDLIELEEKKIGEDTYTLPRIALKEASTQVRVKSGDIVVLGGLLSKNIERNRKSIPILGDIPYLGYLFSQRDDVVKTKEMVILLEPIVLSQ